MKRVFLIVLDSVGIGEMPDAAEYGDEGSNTLLACSRSPYFSLPNLKKLGLFRIAGNEWGGETDSPDGSYARMKEASRGKDTTTGHWEIAGIISETPMPTFPEGFPEDLVRRLEEATGRKMLCNRPYSGTEVIRDYGEEHCRTGNLILYTSADSVLQLAAHEEIVPVSELYRCCEVAREICQGKYGVGRIIARPFLGTPGNYKRTSRRHDYSLAPPRKTMLNRISDAGMDVIGIGKISDIFAGSGVTQMNRTENNEEGICRTLEWMKKEFTGLCFTNLVDYDMLYGHRNDVDGYARALSYFDSRLPELLAALQEEDILMITADHGCDPSTPSTDHSREYTPLLIAGPPVRSGMDLGTRETFADIEATVLDYLGICAILDEATDGSSFWNQIKRG